MLDTSWQSRKATPKQYKGLLAAVGLNQTTGARYFGMSMRTMRRICAGKAKRPPATVMLMHLMCKHGEEPDVPTKRHRRGAPLSRSEVKRRERAIERATLKK